MGRIRHLRPKDRRDGANYWDSDPECNTKPANLPMGADVTGADEGRLHDVEDHPRGEDDRMDRKKKWLGMRRVQQPCSWLPAESVNHDSRNQKRHQEVEIVDQ